eukprot:gene810-1838_t
MLTQHDSDCSRNRSYCILVITYRESAPPFPQTTVFGGRYGEPSQTKAVFGDLGYLRPGYLPFVAKRDDKAAGPFFTIYGKYGNGNTGARPYIRPCTSPPSLLISKLSLAPAQHIQSTANSQEIT